MATPLHRSRAAARTAIPTTLAELTDWIRIPSISGSGPHREDVERAALWVAAWLRVLTPAVNVVPSPSGPTVLARVSGRNPQIPAIVVYGHFDVRPAGPGWTTSPFEPMRHGMRLVARGASDDKGQLMAHLAALKAWHCVGGPPGDVLLVLDGAEEIGSPHLAAVLHRWRRRRMLSGPISAVVMSDTRADTHGNPTVTISQRGMIALRVTVTTGPAPVHAGRFGGTVIDPTLWLTAALQRASRTMKALRTPCAFPNKPRVNPGSTDQNDADALAACSGALTVNFFRSGAAPGAIPAQATAVLDVRVPPGLETELIETHLRDILKRRLTRTTTLSVTRLARSEGLCLEHSHRTTAAVNEACRLGYRTEPSHVFSGGSIPAVAVLAKTFGTSPLLLGFGPIDDGAHGPNEYLDLGNWARAIDTCTVLFATLTPETARQHTVSLQRLKAAPALNQQVATTSHTVRADTRGKRCVTMNLPTAQ